MSQTLQIQGMTCGACVARVEGALKSVPGVTECAVNLTTNLATVSEGVEAEKLVQAVRGAGYDAVPLADASAETLKKIATEQEASVDAVRRRLVLGVLFSIPVLLIDLMHGRLAAIHSEWGLWALWTAELIFAALVVTITGGPFFRGAVRALWHMSANMDVLVALGAGTAYVFSLVVTGLRFGGVIGPHEGPHAEYHAAVVIIVLVTLGKFLEARAKKSANTAVAGLATQSASTATRVRDDGSTEAVAADAVAIGERVQVLAHQTVPVDGALVEGAGSLDQSVLTGESVPVELSGAGMSVPAGARLLDGRIVIRATATAANSTVARILSLVQAAQASKTAIQGLADHVAAIFVPIVLLLAVGTFAAWMLLGHEWVRALIVTIAVIVIACPCAMGLATPTALTVAIGRAARMGILFTNAAALETAGRRGGVSTVIFDKTGTLTRGEFEVVEIAGGKRGDVLRLAASLEQFSDHPLAKAISARAAAENVALAEPETFSSVAGGGIRGEIAGQEYAAGSVRFVESLGAKVDDQLVRRMHDAGLTLVAVARIAPAEVVGMIGLRDALRTDAAETLATLRDRGMKVGVISGDSEAAVRGTLAGVPLDVCLAEIKPDGKAAAIERLARESGGRVAFVGDGINDGPALAAADLGITLSSGTDLAKAAGDVILLSPRLGAVADTLELSRKTIRVIKQNLFWAFGYNVAAIPLAMAGVLSPGIAAGAMILSSLSVVGNALRLYKTRLG